ncbi:unnamed protein product, partial [Didymodactylos carnosus]
MKNSRQISFTWTKLVLSALVPLMIGIFTVVSTIQQQRIPNEHRRQDHQIAATQRKQDQDLANLTRIKDQQIANLTREQDKQHTTELRRQDQRQAKDFYSNDVFKTYIEDILNSLFKANHESKFVDDATRPSYIRAKTLTALRELDPDRRKHVLLFLYETKLINMQLATENGSFMLLKITGLEPLKSTPVKSAPSGIAAWKKTPSSLALVKFTFESNALLKYALINT